MPQNTLKYAYRKYLKTMNCEVANRNTQISTTCYKTNPKLFCTDRRGVGSCTAILRLAYICFQLTVNWMEQSPSWEGLRHSGSQEISRLLWNPHIHCLVHMNSPIPSPCVTFRNKLFSLRQEIVSPSPNPQARGPLLVGCPRLLIQYIRSYLSYMYAVCTRAVWKFRGLAAVHRFYAEGGGDCYAKL
jgi:hypothetical protein